MAKRRRSSDRVVGLPATGVSRYLSDTSVSLPRSTYRDVEALSSTSAPFAADFSTALPRRRMTRIVTSPISLYRHAKRSQAMSEMPLRAFYLRHLPSRVWFCIVRKVRRQVLFAFNKAGFRGSAPKKHYRRLSSSSYGC